MRSRTCSPRGRQGRLTPDRRALAERYIPLAQAMARPLKRAWPQSSDEFESAANFALVEAAQNFDPRRNVRFSTFARRRIDGALRDVHRLMTAPGERPTGPVPPDPAAPTRPVAKTDEDPEWSLGDDTEPVGRRMEVIDEVEHLLHRLPAQYAETCRQIYLHGRSVTETARTLGYTQTTVHRLHKKALAMLGTDCGEARFAVR